jgi:endoplasmic reticulum-Golgi intermediate compartment protein 3
MDVSGEVQRDISHNVLKVRLDKNGVEVAGSHTAELTADVEKLQATRKYGYCGSCYGGLEPESGCCNTCEEVRMSYVNRGWSFTNPDAIEQVRKNRCASRRPLCSQTGLGCSAETKDGQTSCVTKPTKDATSLAESE